VGTLEGERVGLAEGKRVGSSVGLAVGAMTQEQAPIPDVYPGGQA